LTNNQAIRPKCLPSHYLIDRLSIKPLAKDILIFSGESIGSTSCKVYNSRSVSYLVLVFGANDRALDTQDPTTVEAENLNNNTDPRHDQLGSIRSF
jgi:hypothetical protein